MPYKVYEANLILSLLLKRCAQEEGEEDSLPPTAEDDLGASREGSRTDAEAVER